MIWYALSGFWGFAEASFFIFVPDIFLTWLALHHGTKFLATAILITAFCALLGGSVIYFQAQHHPEATEAFLLSLPAINETLLGTITADFSSAPFWAMLTGAVSGEPYKVYAYTAGSSSYSFPVFLILSFFARAFRFLLAITITKGALMLVSRVQLSLFGAIELKYLLWGLAWIVIYSVYFIIMGW